MKTPQLNSNTRIAGTLFLLLLIPLFGWSHPVCNKVHVAGGERIVVHTDREAYIPGETVWFRLYCLEEDPSGSFSHRSRLAYVELIDPHGHVITRRKILLEQGRGAGSLKIPEDLSSGIYSLFHYTYGMKSRAEADKISSNLLIYNPEKETRLAASPDSSPSQRKRLSPAEDASLISLHGLNKRYDHRARVSVQLTGSAKNKGMQTHVSVSVSKVNKPGGGAHLFDQLNAIAAGEIVNGGQPHTCWEQRGILLGGSVCDQQGQPLERQPIVLSFPDTVARVQLTKSDEQGRFQFFIYPDEPVKDLVLSVLNHTGKAVFELDDKYLNEYPADPPHFFSHADKGLEQHLRALYLTRRIMKHYRQSTSGEDRTLPERPQWLDYPFYGQPDERVRFANYQRLDSVTEYFYEIVRSVQTTHEGLRIVDRNNRLLEGQPLYLIDGAIFENYRWMTRLLPNQCKSIEVIRSPFLLQDTLFQGVVALYTQSGDLPLGKMPDQSTRVNYRMYHPSKQFAGTHELPEHLPYFRNTLFWKPELTISGNQPVDIDFFTPDNRGWYKLEVFGFSSGGEPQLKRKYFFVGENQHPRNDS